MKNLITLFVGLIALSFPTLASSSQPEYHPINTYGKSYIFVEQGIEFSIFPDGQFDFVYVGGHNGSNVSVNIGTPNVNISYNSGYNYDMFVQYDDYGAVIQIEDIPIYYDHYGRIIQAGSVEIRYNSRRIVRVGGLFVHYNPYGYFSHCTGYINYWNMHYVYRPWHVYYVRPYYSHCVVYNYPYREYYRPNRYSYTHHRKHYNRGRQNYTNGRRDFYKPGSRRHYKDGRVAMNKDFKQDRRNSGLASNRMDSNRGKNNDLTAKRLDNKRNDNRVSKKSISSTNSNRSGNTISKRKNTITKRGTTSRKNTNNSSYNKRSVSNKRNTGISANKGRPVKTTKRENTVNKKSYAKRAGYNSSISKRSTTASKRSNTNGNSSRSKGSASRRGL